MNTGLFPATAMPDPDWCQALWPYPGEVLAKLGIQPGTDAVDLCCGDGLFTVPLAGMTRRVVAIDLGPEMLELARARAAAAGVKNCAFIAGDAYDLARLVPAPVDLVLIANTFHGVPDQARLAHAVATVLRPGGRCCGRAVGSSWSTGTGARARTPKSSASRADRRPSCG